MEHPVALALLLMLAPMAVHGQRVADLAVGMHSAIPEPRATPDRGMTGQRQMSAITKGMLIGGGIGLGIGVAVAAAFAADSDGGEFSLPFALVPAALGAVIGASIGARYELPPSRPAP